jgi:two-component system KDP operon response regulator KdpE
MSAEAAAGNRVLVVDDDAGLVRALAINLRAHGWQVTTATTGTAALDAAASSQPDVIVLDLGLPDLGGLDVIAGVRGWSRVPIVVLSARQLGDDKVDALDAGADDYVTKPFAMNELLARLRAAVRRAQPAETGVTDEPVVVAGDLTIDLARRRVQRAGEDVRLSPTEWTLLEVLVRNRGRMVGRVQLLHEVWGPAYSAETNYLRVYTAQLRRKLEDDPSAPRHIITQPGMGYLFEI